jgi:hypothetical protein
VCWQGVTSVAMVVCMWCVKSVRYGDHCVVYPPMIMKYHGGVPDMSGMMSAYVLVKAPHGGIKVSAYG